MRLITILCLSLVMMAQVTLSGHCIHNFFECNPQHQRDQREGDLRRPVREVYSAATPVTMSVSVSVASVAVIVWGRTLIW